MDAALVIEIDRDRDEPAYEQVAQQIREAVATGGLKPGQLLPGVRSLAADLGVNLNTIARAYRLLEEDGFVEIRDRSGVEVAPPAKRAASGAGHALREELWHVLMRMRQAGVPLQAIRREVDRQLDKLLSPRRESER